MGGRPSVGGAVRDYPDLRMADDEPRGGGPPDLRVYLWTAGFVLVGSGLRSTPHTHQAPQLGVGLNGPIRLEVDGGWQQAAGLVTDSDVEHGFDGTMAHHAVTWIDPASTAAARLREHVLAGQPWVRLTDEQAAGVAEELRPCLTPGVSCDDVIRCFASSLRRLVGDVPTDMTAVDERLLPVLDALERLEEPTPPVAELARRATMSPSRLQHVFAAEVGMPIRRYALWQRLRHSARLMVDGLSATQAAHRAGFSDAAHLARTWRRMHGQSPTELGSLSSFVTICDDAARRLRASHRGDGVV